MLKHWKLFSAVLLILVSALAITADAGYGASWFSNGVEANGTAWGSAVRGAKKHGALFSINVQPPPGSGGVTALIFCQNNGGNIARDQQPRIIAAFSGSAFVPPDQINENGNVSFEVHATFADDGYLTALCQQEFGGNGGNWYFADAVPVEFVGTLSSSTGDGSLNDSATYHCWLPDPASFNNPSERRQYACTQVG